MPFSVPGARCVITVDTCLPVRSVVVFPPVFAGSVVPVSPRSLSWSRILVRHANLVVSGSHAGRSEWVFERARSELSIFDEDYFPLMSNLIRQTSG
ncbi:hypothetical protein CDG81_01415 [Actinopolyspora erythraea]|nr:hypothetical protein CDG81_01415 [Actinopolyspora erythraea]